MQGSVMMFLAIGGLRSERLQVGPKRCTPFGAILGETPKKMQRVLHKKKADILVLIGPEN